MKTRRAKLSEAALVTAAPSRFEQESDESYAGSEFDEMDARVAEATKTYAEIMVLQEEFWKQERKLRAKLAQTRGPLMEKMRKQFAVLRQYLNNPRMKEMLNKVAEDEAAKYPALSRENPMVWELSWREDVPEGLDRFDHPRDY